MAAEIEYRHVAVKVEMSRGVEAMKRLAPSITDDKMHYSAGGVGYLMFVEHGSNNTIGHDGKKARSWDLPHIGTSVIEQVIRASVYAETGGTWLRGRSVQAESYIRHYRNELKAAISSDEASPPCLVFRLAPHYLNPTEDQKWSKDSLVRHPFTEYLVERGLLVEVAESMEWGQPVPAHYRLTVQQCVVRGTSEMDEWNAAMTWLMQLGKGGYYPATLDYRFCRKESSLALKGWLDHLVWRKTATVAA